MADHDLNDVRHARAVASAAAHVDAGAAADRAPVVVSARRLTIEEVVAIARRRACVALSDDRQGVNA
ncbi:hypothetical protein OKW41_007400 [Paraburkholderia sp. UCT70]